MSLLLTVLDLLKRVLGLTRVFGKSFILKLWAVTSRSRIAYIFAFYHIFWQNRAVYTSLQPRVVITEIGRSLATADQTLLTETQNILSGNVEQVVLLGFGVPGSGVSLAFIGAVSAFFTIFLYFKLAAGLLRKINPNLGIVLLYGVPLIIYGLAIFAFSGRFPFVGVVEFASNFGEVFDRLPVVGDGGVNSSG